MKKLLFFIASLAACPLPLPAQDEPSTYVCYKLAAPVVIDGRISPGEWEAVPWTNDFVDMLGSKGPAPYLQTRVKMAHDDEGFYFAAWMEEPHV